MCTHKQHVHVPVFHEPLELVSTLPNRTQYVTIPAVTNSILESSLMRHVFSIFQNAAAYFSIILSLTNKKNEKAATAEWSYNSPRYFLLLLAILLSLFRALDCESSSFGRIIFP